MQLDEYKIEADKALKFQCTRLEEMIDGHVKDLQEGQRSGSALAGDMVTDLKADIEERLRTHDVELDFRLSEIERRT